MAGRSKATAPQAGAPTSVVDDSPSEHIYIGSDEHNASPATAARTVRERVSLNNPLRRTRTEITLYAEGFLEIKARRKGKPCHPFHLDLHYLDPVPTLERVVSARWFYAALGCGAAAALAAVLARFEAVRIVAVPALLITAIAALVALYVAVYRSFEKTEFCTLHGRAPVLRLVANLGAIKRFRAFVPTLCRAIEEAAERIGDDTSAYLRAEMREHYRLRGGGILSNEVCAESTGRILAQFDIRL